MLRGEGPPQGEIFSTRFRFMGFQPRADLPIYVAALSPKMLRLAGEIADGRCSGSATRATSATSSSPRSRPDASGRARRLDGFDVVAAVPAAVTDDKAEAYDTMRSELDHLLRPSLLPGDDRALGLRRGHRCVRPRDAGRRPRRARAGISEGLPRRSDGDRARRTTSRAGLARYQDAGATRPASARAIARTSTRRWTRALHANQVPEVACVQAKRLARSTNVDYGWTSHGRSDYQREAQWQRPLSGRFRFLGRSGR